MSPIIIVFVSIFVVDDGFQQRVYNPNQPNQPVGQQVVLSVFPPKIVTQVTSIIIVNDYDLVPSAQLANL